MSKKKKNDKGFDWNLDPFANWEPTFDWNLDPFANWEPTFELNLDSLDELRSNSERKKRNRNEE